MTVKIFLIFRPLPKEIDEEAIREAIDPEKDVDCISPRNQVKLLLGQGGKRPATAVSALRILKSVEDSLKGKNILIVNRSMVIGKPLALMLLGEDATVTLAHSKTRDLPGLARRADVLITAIGEPGLIGPDYVHDQSILIDCGIGFHDGKLMGDMDFQSLVDKVKWITPVPGGVGALTNLCLLESVIDYSFL